MDLKAILESREEAGYNAASSLPWDESRSGDSQYPGSGQEVGTAHIPSATTSVWWKEQEHLHIDFVFLNPSCTWTGNAS